MVHAGRRARFSPLRFDGVRPLSSAYGLDRGTPIDRLYIEQFLARHAADIRGRVLEVGDDNYSRRFGSGIDDQDVLHLHEHNGGATIAGDLADPKTLPAGRFDCVILTQTLQYVFDLPAAIANIRRSLRPGGVALITVPAITPLCEDEWIKSHYWLFTAPGLERLLAGAFDPAKVSVEGVGNLHAATAFLHGAAVEEMDEAKLRPVMAEYPVVITARAAV